MKLQRTTLILLVSAIFLGGFVYFYEIKGAPQREAAKTTKQPIFSFEEKEIQSVTIYTDDETWKFVRLGKPELGWQMKKPKNTLANDAAISFLLNLLAKGESDRIISVSTDNLEDYGLDRPSATIEVKLKGEKVHKLALGKPDFNESFLYARADSSEEKSDELSVLLVPIDFDYAVNRPMSEWEQSEEDVDASEESETKENSSETKEDSSETKEKSSETEEESSEAKEDSSETKEKSSETKENSSETKEDSSETKEDSSETEEDSSETKEKSSETKEDSSDAKEKSSETEEDSSDAKEESSKAKEESSKVKEESSDTEE